VNDVPEGDEHRAYGAKPRWQRALVILAGPFSHFLVAALIFAALLATAGDGHIAKLDGITPKIGGEPSPAAQAGLQAGDVITQIGDVADPNWDDIGAYLDDHPGAPVALVVQRGEESLQVTVVPAQDPKTEDWRIGVILGRTPRSIPYALVGGFQTTWENSVQAVSDIGRVFGPQGVVRMGELLFTDEPRTQDDGSSVIGLGQQVGTLGEEGEWVIFFYLFAYVVLFIGLVNLIPLPPLDGGHVAILLLEKIKGGPIDMRRVVPVSAAVLVFLGLYTLAAMYLDLLKPIPTS
jgi:RIP metalloprotease RseP